MKYLRDDKNIVCRGSSAKNILIRNGYFNLVNGYKMPFVQKIDTDGKHIYIGGTSIEQLYEVKKFDEELKLLLLKYITKVEEEVRTLTGYKFDQINDNGKIEWYKIEAYSPNASIKSIMKTISEAYQQIEKTSSIIYKMPRTKYYGFNYIYALLFARQRICRICKTNRSSSIGFKRKYYYLCF